MNMPPPPMKRTMPPPPSVNKLLIEPTTPPISPDLSRFDLEAAVWIHGGYPQVPWADAVAALLKKCRETSLGQICAAAINILNKQLPADVDLTFDQA